MVPVFPLPNEYFGYEPNANSKLMLDENKFFVLAICYIHFEAKNLPRPLPHKKFLATRLTISSLKFGGFNRCTV